LQTCQKNLQWATLLYVCHLVRSLGGGRAQRNDTPGEERYVQVLDMFKLTQKILYLTIGNMNGCHLNGTGFIAGGTAAQVNGIKLFSSLQDITAFPLGNLKNKLSHQG
jgi:hypothetical protein